MLRKALANWVIARALKRPFDKGHIYGPDGTLYMGRYELFHTRWLSMRVHHIAMHDVDPHMHDHPWWFVSWLMRGSYIEMRPLESELKDALWFQTPIGCFEAHQAIKRKTHSIAFRHAHDRHRIAHVRGDVWTLFVHGKWAQVWGFYTPQGKVSHREYYRTNPSRQERQHGETQSQRT